MKYYKYGLALALIVALALFAVGCSKEPLAATVNGKKITVAEVDKRLEQMVGQQSEMLKGPQGQQLKDQFRQRVLDQLIDMEVTLQEVKKLGIKVTDKEIDAKIKEIMTQYNIKDQKALEEALKQQNTTMEQFKEELKNRMNIEKLGEKVTKNVKITDKEIEEYYDTHKSEFATKDQVHVAHILVQNEEDARKVIDEFNGGEDFGNLARKYSTDPGSKDNGGDLSWRDKDTLSSAAPEFWEACWKLEPGQISDVVKTSAGFHVVKLFDKKPAAQQTFDEVKVQLKEELLMDKKREAFAKWLEDAKKKAKIKKLLTPPKTQAQPDAQQQPGAQQPGADQQGGSTPNPAPAE